MSSSTQQVEARRYLSHKIVRAAVIVEKLNAATDPTVSSGNPLLVVDFGDGFTGMVRPKIAEMGVRANVGDYVVWYDNEDWISISPKAAFEKGYTLLPLHGRPPVLMSAENPGGWKLEDLLVQMREELDRKNDRLGGSGHPIAKAVAAANTKIIKALKGAEDVQRGTLSILDVIGPDQGPRGIPRIPVEEPANLPENQELTGNQGQEPAGNEQVTRAETPATGGEPDPQP